MYLKKVSKLLILVFFVLVALRLALPYALRSYVENRINQIPEYHASIGDIDLHLYRGSYTIKKIALAKINHNIPVPFFSAEAINLAIEWSSLLHGRFVGKIDAYEPSLNFVIEPSGKNEQLSIDKEWEYAVKALFPLNFNQIIIKNGSVNLQSFKGNPPFKLSLNTINFQIDNVQKVMKGAALYSTFKGQAKMNQGDFTVEGRVNPYAKKPTFLLNSALRSMQIEQANNFLLHFTHVDVSTGNFSLYSEIAAADGRIHGYAKPIVKNLKILAPHEHVGPIEFLYKGLLEMGSKVITNSQKRTIATKISIEGDIEEPDTSLLSIIGYLLRHAFIQALLPQIDHSVEMKDITISDKHFK